MQHQNRKGSLVSNSGGKALIAIFAALFLASSINAQTTLFSFSSVLPNDITPATETFEMEFRLFDSAANGNQIGATNVVNAVDVKTRSFEVWLDFGAAAFPGADRFIEVRVRRHDTQTFTTVQPRERILSVPYAIRALNATTADSVTGFDPSGFVLTGDPRLSDNRDPNPGSAHYIHNATSQQAAADFNISGTGSANILNAGTQYNIGGNRILTNAGTNNTLAGIGTGPNNTGTQNSFFGSFAGNSNNSGGSNSFFGYRAGVFNFSGTQSSYFGNNAGSLSRGSSNSYFGAATGGNGTGGFNSFFGMLSGASNSNGEFNSFVGYAAGSANITGGNNAVLGANANVGAGNLNFATAIGSGAMVNASNTVVLGRLVDTVQVPGTLNVGGQFGADVLNAATQFNLGGNRVLSNPGVGNLFAGIGAGNANTAGSYNSFFGTDAGRDTTSGVANAFFGRSAGLKNIVGTQNSFFGFNSGQNNTSGNENSFLGSGAGFNNTTGQKNSFFGAGSGTSNTEGDQNAFFGSFTGVLSTGSFNSFIGQAAGNNNTSGSNNSFLGWFAGSNNGTGTNNTFVGSVANFDTANASGFGNTTIGAETRVTAGLFNATAIGLRSQATQNNSLILGGVSGVNGGTSVNVGIGTTTPKTKLHVASGKIYVEANGQGVILRSPVGLCFELTVTDAGALTTAATICP